MEALETNELNNSKRHVKYISVTVTYTSLHCDSVHSVAQAFHWMFILVPN